MSLRALCILLLLVRALGAPALCQSPSDSPSPSASPSNGSLTEVFPRLEESAAEVDRLQDLLSDNSAVETVEAGLVGLEEQIQDLLARQQALADETASLEELRELERAWTGPTETVAYWKETLEQRALVLDQALHELASARAWWADRQETLQDTQLPSEVLERVRTLMAENESLRKQTELQRAALLEVRQRVGEVDRRLNESETEMEALRARALASTFVQQSPPIWSAEVHAQSFGQLLDRCAVVFSEQMGTLTRYLDQHALGLMLHLAVLLLLAFGFHGARRLVGVWVEAEPRLESSARVFDHPLAAALLLTLVFGESFYPVAPPLLWALLGALALIPSILLLRQLVGRALSLLLYGLAFLYALYLARLVLEPVPLAARLLFLVESIAGFLFLSGFVHFSLRPARASSGPVPIWVRVGYWATWVGAGMLLAAFCCACLGYLRLGYLIGDACLKCTIDAVVLVALLGLADGLVMFLLRIRPLNLLAAVRNHRMFARQRILSGLRLLAVLLLGLYALELLTLRRPLIEWLERVLQAGLSLGDLTITLGNVLSFLMALGIAWLLSRLLRFLLEEDIYPRVTLGPGVSYALSALLHYSILVLGFVVALSAIGVDTTKMTFLLGTLGVGLGFGLQNIVSNFSSGLLLLFERPVKVGDFVQLGGKEGTLRRIGLRASLLRTVEGSEVIVPNSDLISSQVLNWTLSDQLRRLDLDIGVAYGTNPRTVTEVLTQVAREHPDVLKDPAPETLFIKFGDSSLDFQLRAWTGEWDRWFRVRSELLIGMCEALSQAGIEIPFPQRTVHLVPPDGSRAT